MSDNEPKIPAGHNVRGTSRTHMYLSMIFPEWSSNRIARWLGMNPRTLQRMMSKNHEIAERRDIPEGQQDAISKAISAVSIFKPGEKLDALIAEAKDAGLDDEIIGAWLAHRYKLLLDRDID
jgi:hypothetical protein